MPSTIVPPNSFHLLPLASQPSKPQPKANPSNKRKSEEVAKPPASDGPGHSTRKGKGKGKSKSKKNGRRPNVPRDLVGKALETSGGTRICWPYNLPSGCNDASHGGQCKHGVHVCAEPRCQKAHSFRIILDSHHKPKLPVHSHLFTKSCQPIEFSQALVA